MFLKYLSIKEFNLEKSCHIGFEKISKLTKFEKLMTIFWIFGPFIYLIERDPADVWLTLISITFICRCLVRKDWNWTKQWWFLFAILLWITSLISALIGPYPSFSFFQGFVWIRFPLYAAAAQVWLGKDRTVKVYSRENIYKTIKKGQKKNLKLK